LFVICWLFDFNLQQLRQRRFGDFIIWSRFGRWRMRLWKLFDVKQQHFDGQRFVALPVSSLPFGCAKVNWLQVSSKTYYLVSSRIPCRSESRAALIASANEIYKCRK